MAVDAVPCGRGDDRRQAMIQPALVATLRTAAAAAGLCWDRWIWARADDGGLALLPADQPGPLLVDEFVRALDRTLAWLNSELPWDSRLRLRVAIHYGTAIPARNGWAGQGAAAVSRLLDSLPIRLALAAADEANLAVILSRQAFDDIVRPGGASLREPDFRLVAVTVKEYSAEAWLRVPSLRPDELVVDRTTVTAGDAAGDLPGPPGEAGVPCGGRDAAGDPSPGSSRSGPGAHARAGRRRDAAHTEPSQTRQTHAHNQMEAHEALPHLREHTEAGRAIQVSQ